MDPSAALPADLDTAVALHVEGAQLDLIELVGHGIWGIAGYPARAELASAVLPVPLRVPAALADEVRVAGRVVAEDGEGVPVALIDVKETWLDELDDSGDLLVAGSVTLLRPVTSGAFRRLRRTPDQVRAVLGHEPRLAVTTSDPLLADDVAAARSLAGEEPVVVLALVGAGRRPYPNEVGLVQALLAALPELPPGSLVVPVPLPALADPGRDVAARSAVAHGYGATEVSNLLAGDPATLDRLVAEGAGFGPAVLDVVRPHRPPTDQRGLVLLFTGLSGSGKSTVAKGVADALAESTTRSLTLLDGDVVRRNLSKGLGFSRADRDLNVRRIGFVAAEVARHGGVAICAPIAPYAATRAAVRQLVTDVGGVFVLVHVATPIEVCEARDRKGLYALARAGKIPEFTGVSDPYETPQDADLVLDTSTTAADEAVDAVLELLRTTGLVPTAAAEREED